MRILNDPAEEATAVPPQEEAVRIQQEIERLKIQMEVLTAKRDEAIKQALAQGIKVYAGYSFQERAPASTISETKLAQLHPAEYDGYCDWYPTSREVKITKTDLAKYLKISGHTNPEQVLADCTEAGKGPNTYTLARPKGVTE